MAKKTINANFYGSCIAIEGNKIVATSVSWECCKKLFPDAKILQEFVDEDGYTGYVCRPYKISEDDFNGTD